jgi:protein subunit release factor A
MFAGVTPWADPCCGHTLLHGGARSMLQMLATKSVARQIDQVNLCLIFRPILWREGKEEAAIWKQDLFQVYTGYWCMKGRFRKIP